MDKVIHRKMSKGHLYTMFPDKTIVGNLVECLMEYMESTMTAPNWAYVDCINEFLNIEGYKIVKMGEEHATTSK